jgi:hypothetical protein
MKDICIEGESMLQLRTSDSHYFKELYFEGENFKGCWDEVICGFHLQSWFVQTSWPVSTMKILKKCVFESQLHSFHLQDDGH